MTLYYLGDMMLRPTNEGMVCSVVLGYAVIANLVGTSYYNMYPTYVLIIAAFGVGIAMVVGSAYYFMGEPRIKRRAAPFVEKVINPYHTFAKRANVASA